MINTDSSNWPEFSPSAPVAIIGAGVIGTKVAQTCARAGLITRLFDIDRGRALSARTNALQSCTASEVNAIEERLMVAHSLGAALDGAQLAFENVPERLEMKTAVLREIGAALPPDAYMGSNTSSLLCTPLAEASGRPERFFNLNFSDPAESALVELMGGIRTAEPTRRFARAWASVMDLVIVELRQEQMGYCFNRLWRAIKKEALRQADQGMVSPEDLDRAWMLSFRTDIGPFGMMDEVGLGTVLAIEKAYYCASGDISDEPPALLRQLVEEGALGVEAGRGFYSYPKPAFRQAGFLKRRNAPQDPL